MRRILYQTANNVENKANGPIVFSFNSCWLLNQHEMKNFTNPGLD